MNLTRRNFVIGCAVSATAGLVAGCDNSEVKLKEAPPVEIPKAKPVQEGPARSKGPMPGSSGGMNMNPGGNT